MGKTLMDWADDSRFITLANLTKLHKRFVKLDEFDITSINEYLQDEKWHEIENDLQPMKDFSINWIKEALENKEPKTYPKEQEYLETFYASMDDRLNLLEGNLLSIKNKNEQLENSIYQLYKNKYKFKYYIYRFLSAITIGKLRKKFYEKKQKYKNLYNR